MTQEAILYIVAAAVGVSALALVLQALLMLGLYRSARAVNSQLAELAPEARRVLESAGRTLEEGRAQIADVATRAGVVLEQAKTQLEQVDELLVEVSGRTRIQMDRLEMVLDDTLGQVHQTVTLVNRGILRPIREINGLAAGLRTAFLYLLKGGRPTVAQATHDEEMFI